MATDKKRDSGGVILKFDAAEWEAIQVVESIPSGPKAFEFSPRAGKILKAIRRVK